MINYGGTMTRTLGVNILIFIVLLFYSGCKTIPPQKNNTDEMQLFEKTKYYKNLRNAEELTLETEMSAQIIISQETPDIFVSYLNANLKIIPKKDSRQKILSLEISPPYKEVGGSLEIQLEYPSPGCYEFKVKTELVLKREALKIPDKTIFPLQAIPEDQIIYTKPSVIIDSEDEAVRTLAKKISQGEDDLYSVVLKAGKWVMRNVQTDFDNSIVSTSQKASWVLEQRKGVCDEKTNLFIGLLRSLGIPTKFVIGFVGVSYNDANNFKLHSWAEVYFPSVGWIPFDVALKQLGFIDATHIKLSESVDISDPFTAYEWQSVDISNHQNSDKWKSDHALVTIKDLNLKTKIKHVLF